ncbi:MAG: TnpV protein [Clostridiales bacterium]|nr:TnpV protein [Clostridiales bacterium]
MQSLYEKMGGTYTLGKDGRYYPDIVYTDERPQYGKYGLLRQQYLKEHRKAVYSLYLLEGRLTTHLNEVEKAANERMDLLVSQMMKKQGINEELKSHDQMAWLGAVNAICNAAEEIVLSELIYV